MAPAVPDFQNPVLPTEEDTHVARESSQRLASFLAARSRKRMRCRIEDENGAEESVAIPAAVIQLLHRILAEMAKGNAITLIPVPAELTTQQAADLLKVSRHFLVERLEKGDIPFHLVGTDRRVRFADAMRYKELKDRRRLDALAKLSDLDQKLGRK